MTKFKKILSLSVSFVVAGLALSPLAFKAPKNSTTEKPKEVKERPEVTVRYDTVYVTDEWLHAKDRKIAPGVYNVNKQTIRIEYYYPVSENPNTISWCERTNSQLPETLRHEMEHARKSYLVKNTNNYAPYVRSKIAAMNEIMAPCSEIIQEVENHLIYGIECPKRKILQYSDSVIINAHKNSWSWNWPVDFTNQEVADAVLSYGITKFLDSVKRGIYVSTIRRYRENPVLARLEPNKECDLSDIAWFMPQYDQWGPLFTYKTHSGAKVDIWRHASPKTRMRVLNSVDSLVQDIYGPGYMMYMAKKQKNR